MIFSYIRRLGSGFKLLNFNIFGGFQKNEYMVCRIVDIYLFIFYLFIFFFLGGGGGGHHKNWTIFMG